MNKDVEITYYMAFQETPYIEKKSSINFEMLQKTVLLNLYYTDMMKMKVRMVELVNYISPQICSQCAANELQYMTSHVVVPYFEIMRLLSMIYSKNYFKTEIRGNEECFVKITDNGIKLCETKYLGTDN